MPICLFSWFITTISKEVNSVDLELFECWASVADGGPTFKQHKANAVLLRQFRDNLEDVDNCIVYSICPFAAATPATLVLCSLATNNQYLRAA